MKPTFFARIVSLLLVPCLVADPVTASGFLNPLPLRATERAVSSTYLTLHTTFEKEALGFADAFTGSGNSDIKVVQDSAKRWGAFWKHPKADWAPYRGRINAFWEDVFSSSLREGVAKTVLDIGTGNFSVANIARRMLPDSKIYAIDNAHLPADRIPPGIQFHPQGAEKTRFDNESIDLFVSMHGLEYSLLDESLPEIWRVMHPDGHGVFIFHHPEDRDVKTMSAWLEQAGALHSLNLIKTLISHISRNPQFSSDTFQEEGTLLQMDQLIRQRKTQGLETGYLMEVRSAVTDLLDTSFSRATALEELRHMLELDDLRRFRSNAVITAAAQFPNVESVQSIMTRHGFGIDKVQPFADEKGLVGWQVNIHKTAGRASVTGSPALGLPETGTSAERHIEEWMAIVRRRMDSAAASLNLTVYKRTGQVLESVFDLVQYWMGISQTVGVGPQEPPTDAELVELGNRLREEWSTRGYREVAGHIHQDLVVLAMDEASPVILRESERRLHLLLGGSLTERLFGLWVGGARVASHLFRYGVHIDRPSGLFFDVDTYLVPGMRRFRENLLQWLAQEGPDVEADRIVSQEEMGGHTPLSFKELMHWGLLAQVNPSFCYKLYKAGDTREAEYVAMFGGSKGLSETILNRMLKQRIEVGPSGGQMEVSLSPEELEKTEDLLADALSLTAADWKARGVVPPWHAHETELLTKAFMHMRRYDVPNYQPFREPILEMLTRAGYGAEVEQRRLLEDTLYSLFSNLKRKVALRQNPGLSNLAAGPEEGSRQPDPKAGRLPPHASFVVMSALAGLVASGFILFAIRSDLLGAGAIGFILFTGILGGRFIGTGVRQIGKRIFGAKPPVGAFAAPQRRAA